MLHLPPFYFLLAIALMTGLHFGFPGVSCIPWPWNLGGIAGIVLGLALVLPSAWQFMKRGTAIRPFQESSALVTEGFYRLTRNPMYLGLVACLLGVWAILGSLTPGVVILIFAWWITARFIRKEETMLEGKFGDAYRDYKRRVRRWL